MFWKCIGVIGSVWLGVVNYWDGNCFVEGSVVIGGFYGDLVEIEWKDVVYLICVDDCCFCYFVLVLYIFGICLDFN